MTVADRLYGELRPLAYDDISHGNSLRVLCDAIGLMFQQVATVVEDDGDRPGWSMLVDVDRAPAYALPWLGQFVGVTVDPTLDEAGQRQQIRSESGMARGTPASMIAAAQRYLTGNRTVYMIERDAAVSASHPAYGLKMMTRTDETPNQAAVLAALTAAKPAGIILDYELVDGQTWQDVIDTYPTWAGVISTYATWQDVIQNTP